MFKQSYEIRAIDKVSRKEYQIFAKSNSNETVKASINKSYDIKSIKIKKSFLNNVISNLFKEQITKSDIYKLLNFIALALWRWVRIKKALEFLFVSEQKSQVKLLIWNMLNNLDKHFINYYDIFKEFPEHFDHTFLWIIRAGESSWSISENILQYVKEQKKIENRKDDIRNIFIKRWLLFFLVVLIAWIIIVFVIPQFSKLFDSWDKWPWILKVLTSISDLINNYWTILALLLIWIITSFTWLLKYNYFFRWKFDKFIIKLPIIWSIVRTYHTSQYLYFVWTLLKKNVNYIKILDILIDQTKNIPFKTVFENMKDDVIKWVALKDLLKKNKSDEFPDWLLLPSLNQALEMWSVTWNMWDILYDTFLTYELVLHEKIKFWINIFDKLFYWFIILLMWILFYAMWAAMAGLYMNAWSIV